MISRQRAWLRVAGLGLLLGVSALGISQGWSRIIEPPKDSRKDRLTSEPRLEESLRRARGDGKYRMLLRQFRSPKDKVAGGDFREMGLMRVPSYAGQTNLPPGYWVYVEPYWYIWRDLTALPPRNRPWGPEQATGEPNTTAAGDFGTAWASLTPDGQDEWLLLEYEQPIVPVSVRIHETWNPGAVERLTLFRLDGSEVEAWVGRDPTPADQGQGVSEIPLKVDFPTNRLVVHLRSRAVRGWNEIDAVALVDASGKAHWAVAAEASSTAASDAEQTLAVGLVRTNQRLLQLEAEVKQLRALIQELGGKKE
ncbi:MAG TPA: hypothetical protein VNK04_26650 [Gemmataceae bacterium]|nr:hypothetical protein [Gemmataceae bacterium]